MRPNRLVTLLLCSGVAWVTPALAQTAPSAAPAPKGADSASDADQNGVRDIVVTAQRRSESAQRVPLAITAVDGTDLARAQVTDALNLTRLVPGLAITHAGDNVQIYLRGVGNYATNVYAEPAVAFNVDNVYVARSAAFGGVFYDLDRVEVLKGPQGTLYGRNATGGAVNVISRKPTDQLSFEGDASVGNFSAFTGSAAVNLPLMDGLALRASGQIVRRDGYFSDGYDDDRSEAGRVHLLYKPSADLSVLLTGDYYHLGGKGPGGGISPLLDPDHPFIGFSDPRENAVLSATAVRTFGPFLGSRIRLLANDGFLDTTSWGVSGNIEWGLGFARLTAIAAHRDTDARTRTYSAGFLINKDDKSKQDSIELRLASDNTSALKWVLGLYHFRETQTSDQFFDQGVLTTDVLLTPLRTRTYAAFGDATLSVSSAVRLIAGLRYTHEDKSQQARVIASGPLSGAGSNATFTGDAKFNSLDYRAGIQADVGPRSMAYLTVSSGFKAGGFFPSLPPNTYRPERLTSFALGSKNRFLDGKLQLNAEAFYWDYRNHQESHLGPIDAGAGPGSGIALYPQSVKKSELYGVDVEATALVTPRDQLSAKIQYLHARYKDFSYVQVSPAGPPYVGCSAALIAGRLYNVTCDGREMPRAPEWSGSVDYQHSFVFAGFGEVDAGATFRFSGSQWLAVDYVAGERQPSYQTLDLRLSYSPPSKKWELSGFVNNVTDEKILANAFLHPQLPLVYVSLRPPRTYGARLSVKFQ